MGWEGRSGQRGVERSVRVSDAVWGVRARAEDGVDEIGGVSHLLKKRFRPPSSPRRRGSHWTTYDGGLHGAGCDEVRGVTDPCGCRGLYWDRWS